MTSSNHKLAPQLEHDLIRGRLLGYEPVSEFEFTNTGCNSSRVPDYRTNRSRLTCRPTASACGASYRRSGHATSSRASTASQPRWRVFTVADPGVVAWVHSGACPLTESRGSEACQRQLLRPARLAS